MIAGRQRADRAQRAAEHLPRRRAAALRRRRPGEGQEPAASRSTTSSARSRRRSARPTSTTSTSSAGRTRSASRPTSSSACSPRTSAGWKSATAQGQMVPLGTLVDVSDGSARRSSRATTSTRRRRSPARPAPGFSSGQALDLMEQMAAKQAARRDGLRVDRHVVPGEAGRRAGALRLRAGGAAGLPRAGRPVRELAHAARR